MVAKFFFHLASIITGTLRMKMYQDVCNVYVFAHNSLLVG